MQPPLETVRLSSRAAEQLQQLKRRTGITNWNTLSRIAFCLSIAHPEEPSIAKIPADSSVEMTWRVFGGVREQIYAAVLRTRAQERGCAGDAESLATYFRAHLHRGIAMLYPVRSLHDLSALLIPHGYSDDSPAKAMAPELEEEGMSASVSRGSPPR